MRRSQFVLLVFAFLAGLVCASMCASAFGDEVKVVRGNTKVYYAMNASTGGACLQCPLGTNPPVCTEHVVVKPRVVTYPRARMTYEYRSQDFKIVETPREPYVWRGLFGRDRVVMPRRTNLTVEKIQ